MILMTSSCFAAGNGGVSNLDNPVAVVATSMGEIRIELFMDKAPKTVQSIRTIELPAEVISILKEGDSERVCALDPDDISYYFSKVLKKEKLPHFRFHDLRAYAASIRHALGIPDVYIMADGGWKTDTVLKQIYRRQMDDKRVEFSKVSNTHFSSIFEGVAHEISHDG